MARWASRRTCSPRTEETLRYLIAAQECGKPSHFVHDVLSPLDVKLLTFNPYHLRVIAASRKKTDKRDAYWLAKTESLAIGP